MQKQFLRLTTRKWCHYFLPFNSDEIYYLCECFGKIAKLENTSKLTFDDQTFFVNYVYSENAAKLNEEKTMLRDKER